MSRSSRINKLAVFVGITSAVALSSCTLPPEQAWRKIRTEGLIAYWAYELDSPHANSHLKYRNPSTPSSITATPAPQLAYSRPTISPLQRPGMVEEGRVLTAQNIPALPGFVRSPYTNPPRLVDVKGATPGTTMICPYTQRPFIVPSDYVDGSGTLAAENRSPSLPVQSPPAPATSKKSEDLPKVVVNNNRPKAPEPKPTPAPQEPKSKPAPSTVVNEKPTTPVTPSVTPSTAPLPAPKPVQEIPFGAAIAGRPGFVNSPFAAKHQLVDVTGLPTGMEVKCPYTGKLFRVPPQDVASSKPAEKAPLASPEEPKKK
jgi:hypothetical protein